MKFDFDRLLTLLRKRADAPEVIELIERQPSDIARIAYQGYVVFKDSGVAVMFKEAPWVLPETEIVEPKALYLDAFHFHRAGHEGHSQYAGTFPAGVAFGDTETSIVQKLGQPTQKGGGGISKVIHKPIPYWLEYLFAEAILHFQFDADGRVDMVTLYSPDLQQLKNPIKR
jgi:hypothetical protein